MWPPGRDPIDPSCERISLVVSGGIPYVFAGSQKSIAHEDEEATSTKHIVDHFAHTHLYTGYFGIVSIDLTRISTEIQEENQ